MNDTAFPIDISLLIAQLGLSDLSGEEKSKIADMLQQTIEAKIKLYLFDQLSDEEHAHLNTLGDNDQAVLEYLVNTKGIDMNQVIISFAQESREELMQDVAYIRGMMDSSK